MRFQKVLFVDLKGTFGGESFARTPSISIGYLSEFLSANNIDNQVMDLRLGYSFNDLLKKIKTYKPDLIAITMMSMNYKQNYKLIRKIKKERPNIPIILGGSFMSLFREKAMQECNFDFGCILEGEHTLLEFCQGKPIDKIIGLMYRKDGKIIYNGDRELLNDLDSLPFPKYGKFELDKYHQQKEIGIFTTRGCPYNCSYCPSKISIGNRFRARSPEHVIKEIKYWYDKGYESIDIVDDNFTLDNKRVYEICDLIEKNNIKLIFRMPTGIRADRTDYKLLKRLKEVGFTQITVAVEAGNNKVLKALNKNTNIEAMDACIKNSVELGYDVSLLFLLGSPTETWKDVQDSIRIATKYKVNCANFFTIIPFPKTDLYDYLKKNKLLLKSPDDYLNSVSQHYSEPLFYTPELSVKQRKRLFKITRNVNRKIVRNHLVRKANNIFTKIIFYVWGSFDEEIKFRLLKNEFLYHMKHKLMNKYKLW